MILLLDADITIYQAACKNQEDYTWSDDCESHIADLERAKVTLDNDVAKIMKATKTTGVIMALSSSPNFRHEVLPSYKHNRKTTAKPILRDELYQYVMESYPFRRKPNLEGDDILGIFMTMSPGKYICATIDKDLKQIPGKHYNFNTETFFEVTLEQGDYYFYRQCLTGDPGDGYSGCPGIGGVKADKLLAVQEGATYYDGWEWDVIVKAYKAKGLTEADALQQARVARILRNEDYDHKLKQPILWSPT